MEQNQVTKPTLSQKVSSNEISLKELWYISLSHWYWYVISVGICCFFAVAYILRTPKSYTRNASILIKEDKSGKSIGTDVAKAFGDMAIGASNTNVYNELLTIKSNDAAKSVVSRLALNVNYTADGLFHPVTLYGTSLPVKVEFPNVADEDFISFDIQIDSKEKFTLKNLKLNKEKFDTEVKGTFGYNITNTPVGRIVITKTPNFNSKTTQNIVHVTRSSVEGAKNSMMKRFSADLDNKNATVITMSFVDVSPQRAEDVLNTVISVYNENWMKDKNQIAISTSEFINDRLRVIERELGNVDVNISSYKSANRITDLKASSQLYLQQSTNADAEILNLNNQIYMAKYIRNYLSKSGNNYQLLPVNTGIDDASIGTQIKEYNSRLLQRNNIVANSSENNPIAVDIDNQLAALRSSLIQSIDNTLLTLQTQLGTTQAYAGQATSKIASNPNQARHLLSEERQQKVKESLYLFLLQKREENELSQAFTAYNTRIVSAPNGSSFPTAPVSRNILLIALVLGFGIPFAIIYLREMQNSKVRGKSDITDRLSAPYLGEIPTYINNIPLKRYQFWKKKREHKNIIVRNGSRGMINEAFRIVATNLEFMAKKNSETGNVLMITSYNLGSGKSFLTGNLGATLGIKGNRVLLVDADLRRASTSAFVNRPAKGIADYLSGNTNDINSLLVSMPESSNVTILPVGTIPPNPSELLASPAFGDVINKLKTQFDYVIIDCPPADMMADATIVSHHADRTLFVVRAGLFERSMLTQLEEDYQNGKLKNAAIILNSTFGVGGRYGYGYKYGYKYGYQYGYGDSRDKE